MTKPPDLRPSLMNLIRDSLSITYQSHSCQNSIPTDNHYQSIALGSETTPGFRSPREDLLEQIRFDGKKVLDLGSNLGELSRAARARGATLVDGYEYDPYFVQVANAVNAYNGVTRVSFFERDITDASTYSERYDIVLAFSVYVYIRPLLALVTGITNELMFLETHRVEDNLQSYYIEPVLQFMPYYRILGESEWGTTDLDAGTRVVVAFGRSESVLDHGLVDRVLSDVEGRMAALSAEAP